MHSVCEELAKEEIAPKQKISFLLLHCLVSILFDAGQAAIVYNLLTSFGSSEIDNGQEICCPLSKKIRPPPTLLEYFKPKPTKKSTCRFSGQKSIKLAYFPKTFYNENTFLGQAKNLPTF